MNSVLWKCKYCGTEAGVVAIMVGQRVRCPNCAAFSVVRKNKKRVLRPRFLDLDETVARESFPAEHTDEGGTATA